jgi:hypothetical protein
MNTKKEMLLEWMKGHSDIESLRSMSQREAAETYCDRMAISVWHQGQQAQTTEAKPHESVELEADDVSATL